MEMFGPEATSARATSVQDAINTTWTKSFGDGHEVSCNVSVTVRGASTPAAAVVQIEADKMSGPSNVNTGWHGFGDRRMQLNANEANAFGWTAAHEFGHILGLDDRYHESLTSKVAGSFGGKRTTTANAGYEGNLMAEGGGTMAKKNVADLASENEPSPWWINDDDQVRELGERPLADGHRQAVGREQGEGAEDAHGRVDLRLRHAGVQAHLRECHLGRAREGIRDGIDLLAFGSIGQRTQARVAFTKMPE